MIRKQIAGIKFTNGAKFTCYLHKKAPKNADPSDVIEVRIDPEREYGGEPTSWFMNAYDLQHVIWLLSSAIIEIYEARVPLMAEEVDLE